MRQAGFPDHPLQTYDRAMLTLVLYATAMVAFVTIAALLWNAARQPRD